MNLITLLTTAASPTWWSATSLEVVKVVKVVKVAMEVVKVVKVAMVVTKPTAASEDRRETS